MDSKEVGVSALKSLLSAIPYIGQALNEALFDYRSRVKQNRVNYFVDLLSTYFSKHTTASLEIIQTEEFGDLFESVIRRVTQTNSKEKIKRFRDILINHIEQQQDYENTEIFLDLVSTLTDREVEILKGHDRFTEEQYQLELTLSQKDHSLFELREKVRREKNLTSADLPNHHDELINSITTLEKEINTIKSQQTRNADYRAETAYGISGDDFLFYKQSLYSKGLLIDSGIGGLGVKSFQYMSITKFGKRFIEFIVNSEADH